LKAERLNVLEGFFHWFSFIWEPTKANAWNLANLFQVLWFEVPWLEVSVVFDSARYAN